MQQNLREYVLIRNINESIFGQIKMEYLDFWVKQKGVMLINKKYKLHLI